MAYLHELRFCHRDLKAANILLARDGTAKIGDFGLTSHLDAYSTLKSNAGTPLWSAPEVQRHGQSGRIREAIAGHCGLVRLHPKAWSQAVTNSPISLRSTIQVQVGTRAYDERCDIYSYAILLLEIEDFECGFASRHAPRCCACACSAVRACASHCCTCMLSACQPSRTRPGALASLLPLSPHHLHLTPL